MGLENMRKVNKLMIDELHFDAAHYLDESFGKCQYVHGHTFFVRNMEIICNKTVDFGKIEETVNKFDHLLFIPKEHARMWDEIVSFAEKIRLPCKFRFYVLDSDLATVENIADALRKEIEKTDGVLSVKFELYEGENKGVEI
jgi:6-pyruvoyl-tetrahydropterin synthase